MRIACAYGAKEDKRGSCSLGKGAVEGALDTKEGYIVNEIEPGAALTVRKEETT